VLKKYCINFRGLAATKYAWFIAENESDECVRRESSLIPTEWHYSFRVVLFLQGCIIPSGWYYSFRVVLFLQGGIILKYGIISTEWYCS